jgi:hypothetical protein
MSKLWILAAAVLALAAPLNAQTISSGSNGSDGALTLTTPGMILFDPTALGLDADGDNVFHFTTINIGPGVTVRLTNTKLKGRAPVWLASGDVTIAGTLDLNGEAGAPVNDLSAAKRLPEPGAGGYHGGVGGTPTSVSRPGAGPGGGFAGDFGPPSFGSGGPAGHATAPAPSGDFGKAYGNALLVPLRGGSGGGGGLFAAGVSAGGGGSGGGALRIFSSTSIAISGSITANGGDGSNNLPTACCGGGGGSGGGIHLIAPVISGSGALTASGGNLKPDNNPSGSVGRIRLDAFQQNFTGTSNPSPSLGSPYNVPLPVGVPTLRVVSVNGVPVPPSPGGSSSIPDITINTANPIPIVIEASNVPLGTLVKVNIFSDAAGESIIDSTPLAGTLSLSTGTAMISPQPGFTRLSVRSVWVP